MIKSMSTSADHAGFVEFGVFARTGISAISAAVASAAAPQKILIIPAVVVPVACMCIVSILAPLAPAVKTITADAPVNAEFAVVRDANVFFGIDAYCGVVAILNSSYKNVKKV